MSDKRQHERRASAVGTYCYIDGVRFDARTVDVSAGGAFIETNDDVPIGMLVIVVLKGVLNVEHQAHLVGRVVRAQRVPVTGIGVQWLRAISSRSEEDLERFLTEALGVKIDKSLSPMRRNGRAIQYEFATMPNAPTRTAAPAPSAARAPPPPALQPPTSFLQDRVAPGLRVRDSDVIDVEVVSSERPGPGRAAIPNPVPAWRRGSEAGPVTTAIRTDMRVPVALPARLTIGRTLCQIQVRALGSHIVAVELDAAPVDPATSLGLILPIPTAQGTLVVKIATRWRSRSADGTVELTVVTVDDSAMPGVYERYLKLLRCREVAGG